jgi:hypothetical protein
MKSTHVIATGVALAVMLGTVPVAGVRVASAQNVGAPTSAGPTVSDEFFRVDFTAKEAGPDTSRISGYIYNNYGDTAGDVQLRVTALDAAGQPGVSYVERVSDDVPPFDRLYFDVQVPGHAPSYRVTVESWDFVDGTK